MLAICHNSYVCDKIMKKEMNDTRNRFYGDPKGAMMVKDSINTPSVRILKIIRYLSNTTIV